MPHPLLHPCAMSPGPAEHNICTPCLEEAGHGTEWEWGPQRLPEPSKAVFWGDACCAPPALGGEPSPVSLCAHVPLPRHPRQRWHPDRIDTAPPASLLLPSLGRGCCAWGGAAPGCPHLTPALSAAPLTPVTTKGICFLLVASAPCYQGHTSPHSPPLSLLHGRPFPRSRAAIHPAPHKHASPSLGPMLPIAQLTAQHLPFSPKPLIFRTHPYGAGEGKLPSGAFLGQNQEPAMLEIPSRVAQGRAVRWWHRLLRRGARSQPVPGAVPQPRLLPSASPRRMGSATSRPARCRRLELLICSSGAAAWPQASSPLHGRSGFHSHPACHPACGFLLPKSTSRCPRMAPAQHGLP